MIKEKKMKTIQDEMSFKSLIDNKVVSFDNKKLFDQLVDSGCEVEKFTKVNKETSAYYIIGYNIRHSFGDYDFMVSSHWPVKSSIKFGDSLPDYKDIIFKKYCGETDSIKPAVYYLEKIKEEKSKTPVKGIV